MRPHIKKHRAGQKGHVDAKILREDQLQTLNARLNALSRCSLGAGSDMVI
ncbi:hypothetical protein DUNSADRAFT_3149 [Dunaliella salina]|uniref:Encoded protein n=1 Tax=Dunaliella salina TaxID=3046 RepID=A0ABQ7H839_DUNSA|nr:hypothetical protein DUNSADRAFT_3149 [Dunaliella salina]|eukprot:KAF5843020.1 hypothetical protein DUNSADRAFT_3149 [Dunaliella salina]